jgi:hypothetical protein
MNLSLDQINRYIQVIAKEAKKSGVNIARNYKMIFDDIQ